MTRLLTPIALLLLMALVGGPVVLEQCVATCSAVAQPSPAMHCHHPAAAPGGSWASRPNCGHDHAPWSAIADSSSRDVSAGRAVLSTAVPSTPDSISWSIAALAAPPGRSSPSTFLPPLRI